MLVTHEGQRFFKIASQGVAQLLQKLNSLGKSNQLGTKLISSCLTSKLCLLKEQKYYGTDSYYVTSKRKG